MKSDAEYATKPTPVNSSQTNIQLDLVRLRSICNASIDDLMAMGEVRGSKGARHSFIDNGSDILAVAHLDTVQNGTHFQIVDLDKEVLVFNPRLDDRLGVYTILKLLPTMGINVDVLLTENEEIGQTTASDFDTEKQYNWMVEFDRHDSDVVSYDYGLSDDWDNILKEHFRVGLGSFSDISELEHLGCKAINIGVGYYREHSHRAHFIVGEYKAQIAKFVNFHEAWGSTLFEHSERLGYRDRWAPYNDDSELLETVYYCDWCDELYYESQILPANNGSLCPGCWRVLTSEDEV